MYFQIITVSLKFYIIQKKSLKFYINNKIKAQIIFKYNKKHNLKNQIYAIFVKVKKKN